MARVSKTSPFRPRVETESRSISEGEEKDEEKSSSSSSTTSSSNSEENTQDDKQKKAKRGRQKRTLVLNPYEMLYGPERAKRGKGKPRRGRGKPIAYTVRLWSKYSLASLNHKPKRGRGKSAAYTLRLWSKYNQRSPLKGTDVHVSSEFEPTIADPKLKGKEQEETDVFQSSDTDSEEACKRIKIERNDDDDTDDNGAGGGAGAHTNLSNLGLQVAGN